MTRPRPFALLLTVAALAACSGEDEVGYPEDHFGTAESWIINGQVDTVHDAVVALFGSQSGCTGTIIHVDGNNAYIVTAAHCFGPGPILQVAVGDNYQAADAVFNVVDYQIHPQYDPNQLVYDFAMIRAVGAGAGTPVIPAMTPAEDGLGPGSPVVHVGYGLISYPNGATSQRHVANGNLAEVGSIQISYNQPVSGPCSGDSGGPNLADMGAGERVAGVISFGDQQCNQFGVSGRVSAIYDSFIVPFIGYDPSSAAATTATTATTSTGVGGDPTGGAGGAQDGPAVGAGAGNPTGDGWIAGDVTEKDYDDAILVKSGCALAAAPGDGEDAGWLALALGLGFVGWGRRRR
ncbi:MAG TPA: S1 family peptidase [Polyangiaceae bacterium]|nr:S1 family peptidase [Polyangiaceae bacterium]